MTSREITLTHEAPSREKPTKGTGHLSRAWSRLIRKKIAVACMIVLVVIYSAGIFANWVTPHGYGYREQDYTAIRQGPSLQHWAGTDRAGRDVLTRVLWGVQNTIIITVIAMATGGLLIGVTLGLVSGYFGRRIDAVIQRTGEIFASFPDIFLVIILAATITPRIREWARWMGSYDYVADYFVIALALASFSWVGMARLVRGQVLSLKETQFVQAAIATGASTPRILFVHLLPNAISPIVVTVTMGMGVLIGTEIILGFVGLGVQPPRPTLGRLLLEAANIGTLRNEPWMLLAPGIAAMLLVLAWNLLGDALNDVLNPRTR